MASNSYLKTCLACDSVKRTFCSSIRLLRFRPSAISITKYMVPLIWFRNASCILMIFLWWIEFTILYSEYAISISSSSWVLIIFTANFGSSSLSKSNLSKFRTLASVFSPVLSAVCSSVYPSASELFDKASFCSYNWEPLVSLSSTGDIIIYYSSLILCSQAASRTGCILEYCAESLNDDEEEETLAELLELFDT